MKYTLQKSVLIFLLALGVTRTNAQDKWSLVSCPDTAWFSMDLFGVNDTIICSIERGTLYTSTDGARSWAKTNNVQSANRYSQQNVYYGGNLYCCNYADRTIHRYNGTNWVIDTLGIQGTRPTKIWAFDNKMFAYTSVGANRYFYYRNNPTGAWIPTTGIPMNSNSVYFLVAKGPNGYYAHSAATGLFFSTDGISFTSVPATNLPVAPKELIAHGNCLFLLQPNPDGFSSVFKSCDAGATWTELFPFKYANTTPGKIFSDGTRVFLTEDLGVNPSIIWVTKDNGATWIDISDTAQETFGRSGQGAISGFATYKNVIIASQGFESTGSNNCVKQYGTLTQTGITEVNNVKLVSVYPSPASQYLIIELAQRTNIEKVDVLNIQGQVVLTYPIGNDFVTKTVQINVESLTKGIYFVKVGNSLEKFVKQ